MDLNTERQKMIDNLEAGYATIQAADQTQALDYYHKLIYQLIQRGSAETLEELRNAAMIAYELRI